MYEVELADSNSEDVFHPYKRDLDNKLVLVYQEYGLAANACGTTETFRLHYLCPCFPSFDNKFCKCVAEWMHKIVWINKTTFNYNLQYL